MHSVKKQTKGSGAMQLVGRKLEIATGEAGLPAYKREAYREQFAARGFDLPDVTHFTEDRKPATPDVSTFGTRLQAAIESSCKFTMTCGDCRRYLRSLNHTTEHDVDTITEDLLLQLQIPMWKREEVGGTKEQRVWMMAIVESVIESTGPS